MNYNTAMRTLVCALALAAAAAPARALTPDSAAKPDADAVKLVEYFLKTPTPDVDTKLVAPFLAVDPETLPERLRVKARGKQIEIRTLIKLHDTKQKGNWLQPPENCTLESVVHPLKDARVYLMAGYKDIKEDEERYVTQKTKCSDLELGCHFSLIILFEKGKPRRLMLLPSDPLMALVAESHGHSGQTNFFGTTLTCMH